MKYPLSVTTGGGGRAARSALPREQPRPLPRHSPTPKRRVPGRKAPRPMPRRAPSPGWRPASVPKAPLRVPPSLPINALAPAARAIFFTALRLSPYGLAFALGFGVALWLLNRKPDEVSPPGGTITVPTGWQHYSYGRNVPVGAYYSTGWHMNNSSPGNAGSLPTPYRNEGQGQYRQPGNLTVGANWLSLVIWETYENPVGGWTAQFREGFTAIKRPQLATDPKPQFIPPGQVIAPGAEFVQVVSPSAWQAPLPWAFGAVPWLTPILPGPELTPQAPPVYRPPPRPNWGTPEAPSVGPAPVKQPGVGTPTVPVPPEIPAAVPEVLWQSVPYVGTTTVTRTGVRHNPRSNQGRVRRTRSRTKERKARMGRALAFLWNATGTVTEYIDTVDILYEALPRQLKVQQYQMRGRQPNPAERAMLVYQHMNELNVEKAIISYIKNDLEDRLYALGGKQVGEAARNANRPIGYEAGGSLTGGGEYVPTEGGPPEWWPKWLPWAP